MTWKLQAAIAAIVTASLCGCQTCQTGCNVDEDVVRAQGESYTTDSYGTHTDSYGAYYEDNFRVSGSACYDDDFGQDVHCGLTSVVGGICRETCALVKVLCSYRWEGDYPDGPLHGWRGSWCGPGGEGSLDNTKAPCYPPGAY